MSDALNQTQVPTPGTQSPPTTPPVTPDIPSAQKPDEMSSKFAALAKKERITRLAQYNLKQKEAAIAKRAQEIEDRFRQWDEEFKKTPLEAIKKRGYSYEDLTKAALNDGKFEPATEIKSVKEEIEKLRQEQAEEKQKYLDSQKAEAQKAEQVAIDTFKTRINETIEANKDKYELTSLYDASDLVFQTVEEHYERTSQSGSPKIMSIDEACALVEQYLESEIDRMATGSKKFQSKYQQLKAKEDAKAQPKSSTTLSNELTSTAPTLLPQATENDRIKRALAALG